MVYKLFPCTAVHQVLTARPGGRHRLHSTWVGLGLSGIQWLTHCPLPDRHVACCGPDTVPQARSLLLDVLIVNGIIVFQAGPCRVCPPWQSSADPEKTKHKKCHWFDHSLFSVPTTWDPWLHSLQKLDVDLIVWSHQNIPSLRDGTENSQRNTLGLQIDDCCAGFKHAPLAVQDTPSLLGNMLGLQVNDCCAGLKHAPLAVWDPPSLFPGGLRQSRELSWRGKTSMLIMATPRQVMNWLTGVLKMCLWGGSGHPHVLGWAFQEESVPKVPGQGWVSVRGPPPPRWELWPEWSPIICYGWEAMVKHINVRCMISGFWKFLRVDLWPNIQPILVKIPFGTWEDGVFCSFGGWDPIESVRSSLLIVWLKYLLTHCSSVIKCQKRWGKDSTLNASDLFL